MEAGSAQFADLSSESRLANLEVERRTGVEADPGVLALVTGGPAVVERTRARIDRDPAVARTAVDENGVVLAFLHTRGGDSSKQAADRLLAAFAGRSAGAARRRRDRLAPGDGRDPERSPPGRADRVPARPAAVVLGLPRLRRRRSCRRSSAPARSRSRSSGSGSRSRCIRSPSSRSTSSRASGSASRSTTRSSSSRAGARRRRDTGTDPRRSPRRCGARAAPSSSAPSPWRRRWPACSSSRSSSSTRWGSAACSSRSSAGLVALVPLPAFLYWLGPQDRRARAEAPAAGALRRPLGAARGLGDAAARPGGGRLGVRVDRARDPGAARPLRRRRRDDAAGLRELAPGRRGARAGRTSAAATPRSPRSRMPRRRAAVVAELAAAPGAAAVLPARQVAPGLWRLDILPRDEGLADALAAARPHGAREAARRPASPGRRPPSSTSRRRSPRTCRGRSRSSRSRPAR